MATKTFKIGLSNTDKQNMAQDIYERLIAMCFDEYDSTKTYNKGDFVVYENPSDTFKLYKCNSDNVTGAWDSSKWDLATFQDLVDDIESAVAFVNDKANVDGNYPTMTVGVADQLSPYDDESGDDQDKPFIFQATGTGNGTQPDFATGSIALMKEKQGNTVVVNNYGRPLNNSYWAGTNATISFNNGVATFTVTQQSGYIHCTIPWINGHKYFVGATLKTTTATNAIRLRSWNGLSAKYSPYTIATTNKQTIYGVMTQDNTNSGNIVVIDERTSDWDAIEVYQVLVIDLTQWFNGDIPSDLESNPENFFRYYQGSLAYNAGTLVNANGRYIKCIGMNQWDEETEIGGIDGTTGNNTTNPATIRSKNYIRVNPNTEYQYVAPYYCNIRYYDANKNYLGYTVWAKDSHNAVPSNVCYIRFVLPSEYGTTYNNDVSINLYYEDESRCLTYEPYEVLTNNDTGTEVLRSAGSVKDYKEPDGTITRLVGAVDLGSLTWVRITTAGTNPIFATNVLDIKTDSGRKALCSIYKTYSWDTFEGTFSNNAENKSIGGRTGSTEIMIRDDTYTDATTFKNAMSGVYLYYELAAPTTEQGTPYSENLVIDDFGSMDFQGTNGVPQGNLIFYPVDYKAFIDTLYNYTEGTPSELALKSDITDTALNSRGYYKQVDLSSGITDVAGLTYEIKKVYKTGNVVTLTIRAINQTGSAISSNSTLFTLATGLHNNSYPIFANTTNPTTSATLVIWYNGNVYINESLANNGYLTFTVSYAVA